MPVRLPNVLTERTRDAVAHLPIAPLIAVGRLDPERSAVVRLRVGEPELARALAGKAQPGEPREHVGRRLHPIDAEVLVNMARLICRGSSVAEVLA